MSHLRRFGDIPSKVFPPLSIIQVLTEQQYSVILLINLIHNSAFVDGATDIAVPFLSVLKEPIKVMRPGQFMF